MDIRVLRYFLAVARERNITRAAENLHLAQPSLSKQLMGLEAELGRRLLIRGKRKTELTDDGILLQKRAEEIVSLLDKTEREIGSGYAGLCGEVAIGGMPIRCILQKAADLRSRHPSVHFEFYSGDATEITERLDHGSLDFAVLLKPVDVERYDFHPLADVSRWGLLMPNGCALATKPTVGRADVRRATLVVHRRFGLQRVLANWAQTDFSNLNIAATYNVMHGDPTAFVRSGLGCLLVCEDQLPERLASGLCFRLLDPPLEMSHALVWRRQAMLSRAARAFLEEVRSTGTT